MQLRSFATATECDESARDWLSSKERENNLILSSLSSALVEQASALGWQVSTAEGSQLVLFWTPPHFLQLSQGAPDAANYAARVIEADLPGVAGPARLADTFAERWSTRLGRQTILHMKMTFYTADRVEKSPLPIGSMRQATTEDLVQLLPHAVAAARDMNLPAQEQLASEVEKRLRLDIAQGKQFIWVDDSSVRALASFTDGFSGRGARIRGVYTPSEFRRRGYGTAIAGTLAEKLLASGQNWVGLFADNANVTSTGMYRRLGFAPEYVYRMWRFE
jgi:predicted GNAT family acetyltransferase